MLDKYAQQWCLAVLEEPQCFDKHNAVDTKGPAPASARSTISADGTYCVPVAVALCFDRNGQTVCTVQPLSHCNGQPIDARVHTGLQQSSNTTNGHQAPARAQRQENLVGQHLRLKKWLKMLLVLLDLHQATRGFDPLGWISANNPSQASSSKSSTCIVQAMFQAAFLSMTNHEDPYRGSWLQDTNRCCYLVKRSYTSWQVQDKV